MYFSELIQGVKRVDKSFLKDTEINDIKIDHRQVNKGDVFIALEGKTFDGNEYIDQAIANGAARVITDKNLYGEKICQVENARKAYALMCKNYFGRACDSLKIIAVTGTNGKTTTCNTIKEILQNAGANVAIIGTLGASYKNEIIDTGFTTPDPYMLHKLFADMKKREVEFVVMEVSAHALALDKLEGVKFEMGVLTNITEDHLDFFNTMDEYAKAKYKLFEKGRVKLGIIGNENSYSDRLLIAPEVPVITYGINCHADVNAQDIKKSFNGSSFDCDYMGELKPYKTNLVGSYNIKNAVASIAVCRALGVPADMISLGLSCINPVEGRFNVIKMGDNNIIVDYAHTPDGLENVLKTAKELSKSKLVVVFGCGGNRDKLKRPIMGKIAQQIADEVILTSDNPRYEEPLEIINEIKRDMKNQGLTIIENRKQAIEFALGKYCKDETIIVAGKGGEKYQDIRGEKIPYNDFDVIYSYYRNHFKKIDGESFDDDNEK